jgi:hypothetical protein
MAPASLRSSVFGMMPGTTLRSPGSVAVVNQTEKSEFFGGL